MNIQRSNTAPTRHRQPKRSSSERNRTPISTSNPQSTRPSTQRKTEPRRRKSITSSDDNSTKSRSRNGHGSNPSSRRTSCTIVDPSRPTRHYRIKSSQSVPVVTNRDIDDVLALHFRSCTLFQNPEAYRTESRTTSADTKNTHPHRTSSIQSDDILPAPLHTPTITTPTNESPLSLPKRASTTTHWTSPSTRRREHEKIDKANSGLRALLRKMMPRCVSGPPPQRFYENDKDMSDVGSVRRYRISLDEAGEDVDEKKTMLLARPRTAATGTRWGCF